jgi:hypothetical protein
MRAGILNAANMRIGFKNGEDFKKIEQSMSVDMQMNDIQSRIDMLESQLERKPGMKDEERATIDRAIAELELELATLKEQK